MNNNDEPRGSLWHRWDPHLHAPGTLFNDRFGGNWEAYLSRIEQSEPRIEGLGVTDYFCIDTYKEVRKRKGGGRLPDLKLLFPNVELRIDTKTAASRAINIHLLFSPEDDAHEEQVERILGLLTFETSVREYRCNRTDLIALGREHDPKQTNERGAMKAGANQFKTTLRDLRRLFRSDRWLRENCLVAIPSKSGDGTAGLQSDDAFAMMRKELERFADIVLSSNPKDRKYWLGESEAADRATIEKSFRCLKPCLHGSDAHGEEQTGMPANERFCWLKGDLSFETLRQAVVEPARRVTIGALPPSGAVPALTIRKISFIGAKWMKQHAIALNAGLVAIIGARGSGKTALADILARGANAKDAGKGEASFLKRASIPVDLLGDAAVTLSWGDGSDTQQLMRPHPPAEEPELIRYLSQHFVEKLCSSSGLATELRSAIERVVFDSTDPLDRLETESFGELAQRLLEPFQEASTGLQRQIDEVGGSIVQEDILRESLPRSRRERDSLAKKIESAKKEQQKLVPKGNEERVKRLSAIETTCVNIQTVVESLRSRLKTIDDLNTAAGNLVGSAETTRLLSMRQKFAAAKLTEGEWGALRLRFVGDSAEALSAAKKRASAALSQVVDGDPALPIDLLATPPAQWPFRLLLAERDKLKAEVGIDGDRKRKYDDAQKLIVADEVTLKRLEQQIELSKDSDSRRTAHVEHRHKLYAHVFEQLIEEENALADLYAPLKAQLQDATGSLSKLTFVVERTIDLDRWAEQGENLFDLRSGAITRGRGSIKLIASALLLPVWRTGTADDVSVAMDKFRSAIQEEASKNLPRWVDPEQRRAWYKDISAWLYSTDHVRLRYGIRYDGVAIEQLSPGTRGVVLLLLYLAIDQNDQRPLIIDQPEENLDPNSVFEELVPHFRDASRRRQVIIVTHNANLVVNTDADQVIVAKAVRGAKPGLPEIDYQAGSLESPKVREQVCQILEGGERAFLERGRRYRLRWSQDLLVEV